MTQRHTGPRTLLEQLIRDRNMTATEVVAAFMDTAATLGSRATMTERHLRRLLSGEHEPGASTRRVLTALFPEHHVDALIGSPLPATRLARQQTATSGGTIEGDLLMAADRARRFIEEHGRGRLSGELLDQIRDDVRELAETYQQRPLPTLLGDLIALQGHVLHLLDGELQPADARELYVLGGLASGMLAKALHDLGDPSTAMVHARTASFCAEQAGHDGVRGWVRGLQALVAYWAGRHHESIRYAKEGMRFATVARTTSMVWCSAQEARAWAALGNAPEARAAIRRAHDAWDIVAEGDLDALGGLMIFTRSRQLYYAAEATSLLRGEYLADATDYAGRAVQAYGDAAAPDWAFGDQAGAHTALAVARISAGELEGVAEALNPIWALAPDQRINGIIACVRRVHKALNTAGMDSAIVTGLQERAEVFTASPLRALTS